MVEDCLDKNERNRDGIRRKNKLLWVTVMAKKTLEVLNATLTGLNGLSASLAYSVTKGISFRTKVRRRRFKGGCMDNSGAIVELSNDVAGVLLRLLPRQTSVVMSGGAATKSQLNTLLTMAINITYDSHEIELLTAAILRYL